MSAHLDLDDLCDVLAGEGTRTQQGHAARCPECAAALADLARAQEPVRAALAALPPPEVPPDLAARLDAALLRAREHELTERDPAATRRSSARGASWLVSSAAAVVVVAAVTGAVVGLARLSGSGSSADSSTGAAAAGSGSAPSVAGAPSALVASSTGTDYAAGGVALVSALPALLRGAAADTASGREDDPLARLHTVAGLADCLAGLRDDGRVPVALDYARYAGAPALVVVLPDDRPDLLDVYVVGADCRAGAEHTLLHTELPRAS